MKKKRIICITVILLILAVTATVFAVSQYKMKYLPGTSDEVTALPGEDTATGGQAYTVSSQVPQRAGYEFIDWTLDYDVVIYRVTYVVNPDKTWKVPVDSTVPIDNTEYAPGDYVTVHDQLTTTVDYAYNEKGEMVKGTWEFTPWDKDDFTIYEDTTVTGGWTFTAAPVTKYHYTVEYKLWDGKNIGNKVHADKEVWIDSLYIPVTEYALPMDELKKPYSIKDKNGKYQYRIVTPSRQAVISYDGYKIVILYEKIPKGQ